MNILTSQQTLTLAHVLPLTSSSNHQQQLLANQKILKPTASVQKQENAGAGAADSSKVPTSQSYFQGTVEEHS